MKKTVVRGILFLAGLCLLVITGCGNKNSSLAVKTNRNGTQSVILPGYTENTLGAFIPEISPPGQIKTETELITAAPVPGALAGSSGTEGLPEEPPKAAEAVPSRRIVVDPAYTSRDEVVEIREKMFIAQVNDVYLNPEDYMGKTLKLEGLFQIQYYYNADPYYFVIRYGPGCCGNDGNAGFEVLWDGTFLEIPEEGDPVYPEEGDWVEAVGVLGAYEEDGYPYLCIALSSLKALDERGAEFVTQ
ncbi:MAG: hypothetical protein LBT93_05255 [Treponema sp.]|jgi:hypothetical protein|nr:hypothetical protein [Treponema sp.]